MTMAMTAARRFVAHAATACARRNVPASERTISISLISVGVTRRAPRSTTIRHSSVASTHSSDADAAPSASASPPSAPATPPSPQSPRLGTYVSGSTTHFGYESVPVDEKEARVRRVFANVADSYDVMNDVMSAGLHRYWKDELLRMTGVAPMARAVRRRAAARRATDGPDAAAAPALAILDVAGGTGDVAFRFVDAAGCAERALSSGRDEVAVTVCDINPEMLRVGAARARRRYGAALLDGGAAALTFAEGNAERLPFADGAFDVYTIAFGLRNVTDVDAALREARRVLRPGGRFLCLEFSKVTAAPLAAVYDAYSFHVIPRLGEAVANDAASYQYLVESIRKFCTQDELASRIEAAGFEGAKYTNLTGGIVAVHEGWSPL